jgi:lysophospholipase L1-like esterase
MKRAAVALLAVVNFLIDVDLFAAPQTWVGSWSTAMYEPGATRKGIAFGAEIKDRTVRNIIRPTLSGTIARLRLTNISGRTTARFDNVLVGEQENGGGLRPGSACSVKFNRTVSVSVPAGEAVYSDPFPFNVRPEQKLTISLHVDTASPSSVHPYASQTNFVSTPGNHSGEESSNAFTTTQPVWFLVDRFEVRSTAAAIATIGDSITAGCANTRDADHRWPDYFAKQLAAIQPRGVLNVGINGNCLTHDSGCFGDSVAHRFARDVGDQQSVDSVIVLAGANDLIQPATPRTNENSSCLIFSRTNAEELVTSLERIIKDARARQIRVFLGTIPPFGNFAFWSGELEAERQKGNNWIRERSSPDNFVDFDALLRDPNNPAKLLAAYDSGDGLHPNDKGAEVMGVAAAANLLRKNPR